MQRQLALTPHPIDEQRLLAEAKSTSSAGAVVRFLGVVRGVEEGAPIRALEYECFLEMAERQFQLLFDRLQERWPLESVRVVHRLGVIPVGEPSLWVQVVAAHRQEAFAACQWLIDEMKQRVPIWKKPVG